MTGVQTCALPIYHAWASPELARQMTGHRVIEETRNWEQPSDHVPLITEFDL